MSTDTAAFVTLGSPSVPFTKNSVYPAICGVFLSLSPYVAQAPAIFAGMVTYYCYSFEEALRRAKIAGKRPGCYFGGITLPSGRKGFAIYQEGKVVERYSVIALKKD